MSDPYSELTSIHPITFDEFWAVWPKRVQRKAAEKAFAKIKPAHHQNILSAIEKQKKTDRWRKNGGEFIPHASTWLNGERWNDEIEVVLERPKQSASPVVPIQERTEPRGKPPPAIQKMVAEYRRRKNHIETEDEREARIEREGMQDG